MFIQDAVHVDELKEDFADRRGPAVRQYLERLVEISRIPGICVAVSSGDIRFVFSCGREASDSMGEIDRETRFQLGCVAGPLIAAVALELTQNDTLSMDAPITLYLPEIAGGRKSDEITTWHLVTHTAGYSGLGDTPEADFSWNQLFRAARESDQIFEPGSVFNYDRLSLALLCMIVERVAGRSISDLVDDYILNPILTSIDLNGSASPTAIAHRFDAKNGRFVREPANRLWHEMRRSIWVKTVPVSCIAPLGEMLATGHSPHSGERVLSDWTILKLRQRYLRLPAFIGEYLYGLPSEFGSGLAQFAPGLYGWDGTGFGQSVALRFSTNCKLGLAVGVNAFETRARTVAVDALLRELGILDGKRRRMPMAQVLPFDVDQLPGRYVGTGGRDVLVTIDEQQVEISVFRPQAPTVKARGSIAEQGIFTIDKTQPFSGIAFFCETNSNRPCIQIGLNAYRKH